MLDVPDWPGHRPGQHLDVRLTADDGYTAQRSYSIANAPEAPGVELVVQPVPDGEVSSYLAEDLQVGDALELRGPVGGYFIWESSLGGPVQLIAGGSGAVPLLAMVQHHELTSSTAELRLLYAARSAADLIGAERLAAPAPGVDVTVILSREAPAGWTGLRGRIDADVLREHTLPPQARPQVFVCGPTGFVEAVTGALVEQGHPAAAVKAERFGSSGGAA